MGQDNDESEASVGKNRLYYVQADVPIGEVTKVLDFFNSLDDSDSFLASLGPSEPDFSFAKGCFAALKAPNETNWKELTADVSRLVDWPAVKVRVRQPGSYKLYYDDRFGETAQIAVELSSTATHAQVEGLIDGLQRLALTYDAELKLRALRDKSSFEQYFKSVEKRLSDARLKIIQSAKATIRSERQHVAHLHWRKRQKLWVLSGWKNSINSHSSTAHLRSTLSKLGCAEHFETMFANAFANTPLSSLPKDISPLMPLTTLTDDG